MIVQIPTCDDHRGISLGTFMIRDRCPKCGAARGVKRWIGKSYDGSRWLFVDCWKNACGHIDMYRDVRKEGLRMKHGGNRDKVY
ncbi:MAG: hypothetical protein K9J79_12185 [Desulfobacteraceae bacterium]|nr:hypothetical protein [Desulfobacteraceae bacterium]